MKAAIFFRSSSLGGRAFFYVNPPQPRKIPLKLHVGHYLVAAEQNSDKLAVEKVREDGSTDRSNIVWNLSA